MSETHHEHQTVLLNEAVEALGIVADGCYIDATFGRGGHSRAILQRLGKTGRLVALDRDRAAVESPQADALRSDERFSLIQQPFARLDETAKTAGVKAVDGILLDLGVSSPQLEEAQRGFSFRNDGDLDMRMDQDGGETAAAWLAKVNTSELTRVIKNYGEERRAFQIAKKIVAERTVRPITTSGQLAEIVRAAVRTRETGQDAATRAFQAIRIHINSELEQLEQALPQAAYLLKPGGRLVVISFHSLEDRIVKRFMRAQAQPDTLPRCLPVETRELPAATLKLIGKAQRPGATEVAANRRARSAIMRVAEKCDMPIRPTKNAYGDVKYAAVG